MVGIEIGYIHQLWHWLDNIQFHGLMDSQFWNRNHMQATVRFSKACCKVCCKVCICMFFFCWSVFVFKAALSCLIPLTRAEIHGEIRVFEWNTWKTPKTPGEKTESPRSDESGCDRKLAIRLGVRGPRCNSEVRERFQALKFRTDDFKVLKLFEKHELYCIMGI